MIADKQMYLGAPWCIGNYNNFKINQPQLITLLRHDYVIWKDEAGNLNAIDNVCPHAGANLAKGGYIKGFEGKSCIACPYHGNKVQLLGDGNVIVEGNTSSQPLQAVLPLQVVDDLVWTYGLNWQEKDGKLVSKIIEPKLPIPDYSNIPFLPKPDSQLHLSQLERIYFRSGSINGNVSQFIWNIHDAEHFAGTHRHTMLAQEVKIDNFIQNENHLSWQLITYKRDDKNAKRNKLNLLIDRELLQSFNTFLPGLAFVTVDFKGQLLVIVLHLYPDSPTTTKWGMDAYLYSGFPWWQKLLKIHKIGNKIRDRLLFEDISIVENLAPTFEKKITLKNDTVAESAMNYLRNWN